MGKTSATRVALAPAFVPCENNRNVTFWSERAWVRTPPVRSRAPSTRAATRPPYARRSPRADRALVITGVIHVPIRHPYKGFFAYHFTTIHLRFF